MTPRLTSEKNPLRIDSVAVPGKPGTIGMTLCPGKKDPYAKFGAWDRDLQADLQVIRDWGAAAIVSLMEHSEFWADAGPELHGRLAAGERVLIHCRAGLGRTGMIASRLLVEAGLTPVQAMMAVRRARPGTVETMPQEQYLLLLPRRLAGDDRAGLPISS
jgi:ADP-ribosyl-[dinitrogen reductase] hydrolase